MEEQLITQTTKKCTRCKIYKILESFRCKTRRNTNVCVDCKILDIKKYDKYRKL